MIAAINPGWFVWPVVLVAATGLAALFCGMETGIYVVNKVRLDLRAEAGGRDARRLRRLLRKPNNLLSVLLIGTNVASYAVAFALTAMFDLGGMGGSAEWYALAAGTLLLFVLGDTVPKTVFHRLAETLTYRMGWAISAADWAFKITGLSYFMRAASWLVMLPVRRTQTTVAVESRLADVFAEGQASGVLTHMQAVMVDRVMHIADVKLADVMVPIRKAICIRRDTTREVLMRVLRKHNYSRVPVLDDAGDVVGILDVYDVLVEDTVAVPAERMTPPMKLPAAMTVTEALYAMRRERNMMAVAQKDSKAVGIVTIKDLVEEIVGELEEW
jgi:CBS domain containing-hemolysin-like protein